MEEIEPKTAELAIWLTEYFRNMESRIAPEIETSQTIDIVNTYGLEVNLVGEGSRSYGSRKAKGRTVSVNSDTDLSHTFYWFSTNPDAASVTQDGVVTIHNDRAAEIEAIKKVRANPHIPEDALSACRLRSKNPELPEGY